MLLPEWPKKKELQVSGRVPLLISWDPQLWLLVSCAQMLRSLKCSKIGMVMIPIVFRRRLWPKVWLVSLLLSFHSHLITWRWECKRWKWIPRLKSTHTRISSMLWVRLLWERDHWNSGSDSPHSTSELLLTSWSISLFSTISTRNITDLHTEDNEHIYSTIQIQYSIIFYS